MTVAVSNGSLETKVRLQALHLPSLGQKVVSLTCLNDREGVGFRLSEWRVPSLTRKGARWEDIRRTSHALLLLPGRVVEHDVMRARKGSEIDGATECRGGTQGGMLLWS